LPADPPETAETSAPTRARPVVIAIDGPAASGKGTLARAIADHYGFARLETGRLYRGVGWLMLQAGRDPADADAAAQTARAFSIDKIENAHLRTRDVARAASIVAANPAVRAALLDYQRRFAAHPPQDAPGAVLDGRDIGTVVRPDALVKFYVDADVEERARRRHGELVEHDPDLAYETVLADLKERDARDAARKDAPMKPADDAELIDTTGLSIDAVIAAARRIVDDALARCDGRS